MRKVELGRPELELAKKISHQVWEKYDDQFGYRTEKQTYNDIVSTDVPDNIWFFWGQFDHINQLEFTSRVERSKSSGASKLRQWTGEQMAAINDSLLALHEAGIDL